MTLPTKKTQPSTDPMSYSILLYGQEKAGKSTFASNAPNAIFIATEPGLNALSVFKVDCSTWPELLAACAEIAKGDHDFKTVVIDTIDNAYDFCVDHVCKGLGIDYPLSDDYGASWRAVNREFRRVINRLGTLPYGLILIGHSKVMEVKSRTGKYDRTVPTLGGGGRKVLLGLMNLTLMVEVDSVTNEDGSFSFRRIIHTKPTPNYDAGAHIDLQDPIDLNYDAFMAAFKAATNPTKKDKTK